MSMKKQLNALLAASAMIGASSTNPTVNEKKPLRAQRTISEAKAYRKKRRLRKISKKSRRINRK